MPPASKWKHLPRHLFRLTSVFALAALLFAGAFTLTGTTFAQSPGQEIQGDLGPSDVPPEDEDVDDDGTEESNTIAEHSSPDEDEEEELGPAFSVNLEFNVETECASRSADAHCESENLFFVFNTAEEYYQFLTQRTDWQNSRRDTAAPDQDMFYWSDYRSSTERFPVGTLAESWGVTDANLTSVGVRVPLDCADNIYGCSYLEYAFDFENVDQATAFMEEREEWLDAISQSDTTVSSTWWQSYPYTAPPPPPFLANQEISVEIACEYGRNFQQDCDTATYYFNFHTEAQYFNFLKQRGDWQMRRFNNDRDAADVVTVDYDYYTSFEHSGERYDRPELDITVSDTMTLDDVAVSVNSVCNSQRSHCSQFDRYFDFDDNEHAVSFAQARLEWLRARFAADRNADTHWWKTYDWTQEPGEPNAIENLRLTVDTQCTLDRCWSEQYYFNFATMNDYLYFLKKQTDWRMYLHFRDIKVNTWATHWQDGGYEYSEDRFPENSAAKDPVRSTDIDFDAWRIYVPIECEAHNFTSCNSQLREFDFLHILHAVEFMQQRAEYHQTVLDGEDDGNIGFWRSFRSWEWQPEELQGLRINNIPWCVSSGGTTTCHDITRYFWWDTWRERGAFQGEHNRWREQNLNGNRSNWNWWHNAEWGYDADGPAAFPAGQNRKYDVPVMCSGPYFCIKDTRYFHFADQAEKDGFDKLHAKHQNDGNTLGWYWWDYDSEEDPH